jgi:hypothetical protein
MGYIQGIGLDTSVYPYRILYPGLPGEPAQWFDKMSYCAGESTAWTSPFGWLHSLSALSLYGKKVGRAGDQGPVAPQLLVSGVLDANGGRIVSVVPARTVLPQPATSQLQLVARNSAGDVVATVKLFPKPTHDDPSGLSYLAFQATVPSSGVQNLEVLQTGTVVARRVRAARAPSVRVLAPARHARVGGHHAVALRWKASEVGQSDLIITVAYSGNAGRSWRVVYLGPNRGHVQLPSWYFAGSRRARVRITASDGWAEGSAVSAPFAAIGSPPRVLVTSPARGIHIAGDTRLQLSGEAFDQTGRLLRGRHLRWLDGPFALGTGSTLSAEPLPPGRNLVRFTARDATGASATATVPVFVSAVKLPFLHLRIPARVSRRTRQVTITASALTLTTLTVNGRRYTLSRHTRRITLAIGRRAGLLVEMVVSEQGVPIPFAAEVLRSG